MQLTVPTLFRASLIVASVLVLTACGGSQSSSLPSVQREPASITLRLTPTTVGTGGVIGLAITVRDQAGQPLAHPVACSTTAPGASIDDPPTAITQLVNAGRHTVTCSARGYPSVSASAVFIVTEAPAPTPASVTVSLTPNAIEEGASLSIDARVFDLDANEIVTAIACSTDAMGALIDNPPTTLDSNTAAPGEYQVSCNPLGFAEITGSASFTITPGQTIGEPDSVGIFAQNNYVVLKIDPATVSAERRFHWGTGNPAASVNRFIAGDFDADGRDEIGLYSSRLGRFYLANRNTHNAAMTTVDFGPAGNPPGNPCVTAGEGGAFYDAIAGNFDGVDGDEVAVFDPTTAEFHLNINNTSFRYTFGVRCGIPIAGDFLDDGQSKDGIGVFDRNTSTFYLKFDATNTTATADLVFVFNPATGLPTAGDWDGDGVDTVAILSHATPKTFYLATSNSNNAATTKVAFNDTPENPDFFNQHGGVPLAGKWDTEGIATAPAPYPWTTDLTTSCLDTTRLQQVPQAAAAALPNSQGILIACGDNLVFEHYFKGFNQNIAANVKSVSKSILSALWGVAFDNGYFGSPGNHGPLAHLDSLPLHNYLPGELPPVSLYNLVTMSAGFAWNENKATLPNLRTMTLSNDWVRYVVTQRATGIGRFNYNTGLTHTAAQILTDIARVKTNDNELQLIDWAEQMLFDDLGITPIRWDFEPNDREDGTRGSNTGGWELWLRPRDTLRFGQLYLEKGKLNGRQLLSEQWIDETADRVANPIFPSVRTSCGLNRGYAGWWWLSTFVDRERGIAFNGYHAIGFGGQHIIVIPDYNLITVMSTRISGSSCANLQDNWDFFRAEILPALIVN